MNTPTASEAYSGVSKWANTFLHNREEFIEQFLKDHNTLQQQIGSLFIECLIRFVEEGRYDARNEALFHKCEKIKEALPEGAGAWAVPLI